MAHIASEFTCVYCTTSTAGTIFGTTDVYELGFSYLSISIFKSWAVFAKRMKLFPDRFMENIYVILKSPPCRHRSCSVFIK